MVGTVARNVGIILDLLAFASALFCQKTLTSRSSVGCGSCSASDLWSMLVVSTHAVCHSTHLKYTPIMPTSTPSFPSVAFPCVSNALFSRHAVGLPYTRRLIVPQLDDEAVAESLNDQPDEGVPKRWSDGMEDVMAGIGHLRFSRDMRVQEVWCDN